MEGHCRLTQLIGTYDEMMLIFSRYKLSVIKVIFCTVTVLIVNEIGLMVPICFMHIVNGAT